jgi:hypothetical protein
MTNDNTLGSFNNGINKNPVRSKYADRGDHVVTNKGLYRNGGLDGVIVSVTKNAKHGVYSYRIQTSVGLLELWANQFVKVSGQAEIEL